MTPEVQQVIEEQYRKACNYQTRRGIRFDLTLEEFTGLWSSYRLNKLEQLIETPGNRLQRYLNDLQWRPVCGWTAREERATGVMHKGNARIMTAQESRRMFQTQKGDKLRPDTIAKMSKPKSEQHRANMRKPKPAEQRTNMRAAALERWAKARANLPQNDSTAK